MKKFYDIIYIGILMLLLAGCQDEGMFTSEDNLPVNVVYQVEMTDVSQSRSLGNGSEVDELIVGMFNDARLVTMLTFEDGNDGKKDGKFENITIPMMTNETYDLVFWAQGKGNDIYNIDRNDFDITIDYSQYNGVSLSQTNGFDAFAGQQKNVSVNNPGKKNITLTRPFAQLNVLATSMSDIEKVSFNVTSVYKTYNPYKNSKGNLQNQDFSILPDSEYKIQIEANTYYYLATVYLLAPAEVALKGGIYKQNEDKLKDLDVPQLPLEANSRTNLLFE